MRGRGPPRLSMGKDLVEREGWTRGRERAEERRWDGMGGGGEEGRRKAGMFTGGGQWRPWPSGAQAIFFKIIIIIIIKNN